MGKAVEAVNLPTASTVPPPPVAQRVPQPQVAKPIQSQSQTLPGLSQSQSQSDQQQQQSMAPPVIPPEPVRVAQTLPYDEPKPQAKLVKPIRYAFRDRLTNISQGMLFVPVIVAIALVPFMVISQNTEWAMLQKLFLLAVLLGWSMLIVGSQTQYRAADSWGYRMCLALLGVGVGAVAFWLDGWPLPNLVTDPGSVPVDERYVLGQVQVPKESAQVAMQYLIYFATVLGIGRWWRAVARDRKERFSMLPLLAAAFWGIVFCFIWPWSSGSVWLGVVPLILAVIAVQVVSPWSAPPPPAPRKLRYRAD